MPLRQGYSSTETGPICLDVAPPERVQRDTVGTPLDGVEVRVGDDPTRPFGPERVGRIWVRSPSRMAGYGFPACLERPGDVDGWWPTQDLGALRADGYLVLAGRMDDAIRTRDNRTINLAHVAASLRQLAGARDAVVVPLDGTHGRSFGAVVECDEGMTAAILRARLASVLPPWAWPSGIEPVPVLPRLPNGKPDRQACARLLAARMAAVMDERTLVDQLRAIVTGVVGAGRVPAEIDGDTPLAEGGFWLDSVELLEVILACESKFGITFKPAEDLIGDGLRSLGTLGDAIRRRSPCPSSTGSASRAQS